MFHEHLSGLKDLLRCVVDGLAQEPRKAIDGLDVSSDDLDLLFRSSIDFWIKPSRPYGRGKLRYARGTASVRK
jgi:hypothetical protein